MKVRLGFAVMTHVDADLLLVDEVLAVGDADFQEKCTEVFLEMHGKGRTILLVTHSMPTVTDLCDRALLLDDGEIDTLGAPDLVAERYYTVCLDEAIADSGDSAPELLTDLASAVANPVAQVWTSGSPTRSEIVPTRCRVETRSTCRPSSAPSRIPAPRGSSWASSLTMASWSFRLGKET